MQQYSIKQLKEDHLDQATAVVVRSFLTMNPIWKKYSENRKEISSVVRGNIIPALHSGWSVVIMRQNKIVGLMIQYDFYDYLRVPTMPSKLQLFQNLGIQGKKLQSLVDLSYLKPGEALFGVYGVIDPQQSKRGVATYFWWLVGTICKYSGWKQYYTRSSNPVSLKMFVGLGGEIVSQVECQGQKLTLLKFTRKIVIPTYRIVKWFSSNKKKKISPKL